MLKPGESWTRQRLTKALTVKGVAATTAGGNPVRSWLIGCCNLDKRHGRIRGRR
jgi:hypothetical protein